MQTIHPESSLSTARLAIAVVDAGHWEGANAARVRDHAATIQRIGASNPADGSPAARVMHNMALQIAAAAKRDERAVYGDGRDMSWLRDPVLMDRMDRDSFVHPVAA